jgi:hypothetical protein
MTIASFFAPDLARYDGVRPVNIWLLRLFYFLMAAFVATDAWRTLLTHRGPWEPMYGVAVCLWATYPTLALLGLIHPLRMLPIMLVTIGYKMLWLMFVAWPLWRTGTLAGSSSEELATVFVSTPILMAIVPWGYVYRTYVQWPRRTRSQVGQEAV